MSFGLQAQYWRHDCIEMSTGDDDFQVFHAMSSDFAITQDYIFPQPIYFFQFPNTIHCTENLGKI